MGLTRKSTGADLSREKNGKCTPDFKIAIVGNPNVGKSTVFNALTGMNQHTGNWTGKTVSLAEGCFSLGEKECIAVDVPGTYSLAARSAEEEIAKEILCSPDIDAIVVVCDATCLERNLILALQILALKRPAVICVNLLDEASRKGIEIDLELLEERLGVPAVGAIARKKDGLRDLLQALDSLLPSDKKNSDPSPLNDGIESENCLSDKGKTDSVSTQDAPHPDMKSEETAPENTKNTDEESEETASENTKNSDEESKEAASESTKNSDEESEKIVLTAERIYREVCRRKKSEEQDRDRLYDRLFTGKKTAYPIMLALLAVIFWITIVGANYPSQWLSTALFWLGDRLGDLLMHINCPNWLYGVLIDGAYRTLAWIVSVMLPPMAIFFPLFTLLEDSGYLPRVAFNLDKPFKKCNSCGKQALTMCMGFGCNATGVVGCRIIDSPRERMIAMLTNSLVPCNGRFPLLVTLLSIFFVGGAVGFSSSLVSALLLTAFIILAVGMTFLVSKILSITLLRGLPSAFTLELPPYRRPQICKTLIRSVFDRTIFVLGRAVISALPAGILIWLMENLHFGDLSLLTICSDFLDPFACLLGLDGVILLAFILALPANEIVIPIIIMAYTSANMLTDHSSLFELKTLFIDNGWTLKTALCTMLFSLFHWPCATTLLTIKKESGSWLWTLAAVIIPTICGIVICMATNAVFALFGA